MQHQYLLYLSFEMSTLRVNVSSSRRSLNLTVCWWTWFHSFSNSIIQLFLKFIIQRFSYITASMSINLIPLPLPPLLRSSSLRRSAIYERYVHVPYKHSLWCHLSLQKQVPAIISHDTSSISHLLTSYKLLVDDVSGHMWVGIDEYESSNISR